MSYVSLSLTDLGLAALLLILNGLISLAFRLQLEKSLAIATLRMVVQLGVVGFVLKFVFAQTSPAWTAVLGLLMVAIAGWEVLQRQDHRFKRWWAYGLGSTTLLLAGSLGTLYAVAIVIRPEPWYAPRFVLPILGMVLGSALTSVSLALQTLADATVREQAAIEARLALGATRFGAFSDVLRRALRTALTPILNAMAAAGIVALPGMMTGQILAGADPAEAAKYQIMIMFLLAGATALGAFAAAIGGVGLLTDARHRLRLDRVARR
jgi:putative ABC transport system permease protein